MFGKSNTKSKLEHSRRELAAADAAAAEVARGEDAALADASSYAAWQALTATAANEIVRLTRLVTKLEADAAAEAAREADAAQKKIEAEATKDAEAAAALATKNLTDIGRLVRQSLSAIAKADEKIRVAQKTRSPDLPPLQRTEDRFRSTPKLDRKVLSETVVERWVYAANGTVLSKEIADTVVVAPDRVTGKVYYNGGGASSVSSVEKRRFRKVVFHPEVPGQTVAPLAQMLAVPGLTANDPPAWEPMMWADPAAVLAQLQIPEGPSGRAVRQTKIEMIPLEQQRAADAAA